MNVTDHTTEELHALQAERRQLLRRMHQTKVREGHADPADLASLQRLDRRIHSLTIELAQARGELPW